jgi:hypothetical protein
MRIPARRAFTPALFVVCVGCGGGSAAARPDGGSAGAGGSAAGAPGGAPGHAADGGLNATAPPGSNFDLSLWELQEPIGAAGSPTIISPAMLAAGYQDSYFFTDPIDGAMTFWDPENGVTTADSSYPRSELREMNADGSAANWPVAGTNVLAATVAITEVPDHVCIGQIHIGSAIQSGLAAHSLGE